jgi:hypothetical protein
MRRLVTRYLPSPAMVVACAALAVALGGSIQGSDFSAAADGSVYMTNGVLSASGSLWLDGISFLAES